MSSIPFVMVSMYDSFFRYARSWWDFIRIPRNLMNVCVSFLFLYLAYEATMVAGAIATKNAPIVGLSDIVLSNIPRIDTSFIHGEVSFFLYDMRWWLFLIFIRYAPFAAKALALLIFLRAITINMTGLGIPDEIVPTIARATFGGDLFFSGHVANLFMLGLCFWSIPILRYFFMSMSLIFGISALLGHYHYTIDVVAAPFFAYGVFVVSQKVFKEDYALTTFSGQEGNDGDIIKRI